MLARDSLEMSLVTGLLQCDLVVLARNVVEVAMAMPSVEKFVRRTAEGV